MVISLETSRDHGRVVERQGNAGPVEIVREEVVLRLRTGLNFSIFRLNFPINFKIFTEFFQNFAIFSEFLNEFEYFGARS